MSVTDSSKWHRFARLSLSLIAVSGITLMAQPYSGCRFRFYSDMQSRGWLICLGCFLPSTAIASETDPQPNDGNPLEDWRQVKKLEHDPPAPDTAPQLPASALGNIHDHENDGGTDSSHTYHLRCRDRGVSWPLRHRRTTARMHL